MSHTHKAIKKIFYKNHCSILPCFAAKPINIQLQINACQDKCDKDRRFQKRCFPRGRYSSNLWVSYRDDALVEGSSLEIPPTLSLTSWAWLQNRDHVTSLNLPLKTPENQTECLWPSTFSPGPSLDVSSSIRFTAGFSSCHPAGKIYLAYWPRAFALSSLPDLKGWLKYFT